MAIMYSTIGQNPLRVTQGPNQTPSHQGRQAIDFGGANYGGAGSVDTWVDQTTNWQVMQVQSGGDHFVYFQTTQAILWADGSIDWATLAMCHRDDTSMYKVGQVINAGSTLYKEGTYSGGRRNAVTAHIHVQVGKGKFVGGYLPKAQNYKLPNEAKVQDLFWVPDAFAIAAAGGLTWKRVSQMPSIDTQEGNEMKARLYTKLDETARTSELVAKGYERALTREAGKRVLLHVETASSVTADNISAVVDTWENEGKFADGSFIIVTED